MKRATSRGVSRTCGRRSKKLKRPSKPGISRGCPNCLRLLETIERLMQIVTTQHSPRPMQEAVSATQQISAPTVVMPDARLPAPPKLPDEFEFVTTSSEVMGHG